MPLASDLCICLRRVEFSETSQILHLASREHGLLKLVAKGAHRRTKAGASKFDGGIDLLDCGDAVFTDDLNRELGTLTEWKLRDGHLGLRGNLRSLYLAQYAAEMTLLQLEARDPHRDVFDELRRLLDELGTPRLEEAFLAFELELLKLTGHLPQLMQCVACGKSPAEREAVYFSPARGGLVCRNCEGSVPDRMSMDGRLLRMVQGILRFPQRLPRLTRMQTDPINRLLGEYLTHTLGRKLRMWRYVIPHAQPRPTGQRLPVG